MLSVADWNITTGNFRGAYDANCSDEFCHRLCKLKLASGLSLHVLILSNDSNLEKDPDSIFLLNKRFLTTPEKTQQNCV